MEEPESTEDADDQASGATKSPSTKPSKGWIKTKAATRIISAFRPRKHTVTPSHEKEEKKTAPGVVSPPTKAAKEPTDVTVGHEPKEKKQKKKPKDTKTKLGFGSFGLRNQKMSPEIDSEEDKEEEPERKDVNEVSHV